jgi:hypothetical protein
MTYDVVNPGPGLGQAQTCSEVKSVNGTLPSTPDLNSNDNNINNNLSPLNVHKNKQGMKQTQEKFEETKRIIISRKSKDRQYNGQKKKEKKCLTFKKIVKIEMTFCSLNLLKYIPYLGD